MRIFNTTLIILFTLSIKVIAGEISGVPSIIDGDTIKILNKRIRFHGIDTPEKKQISLQIPPGTNNGVTMNIAHHGVPRVNTNNRGNLYVKIRATTPKLSTDELRKIQEIKNGINLRT